MIKKEGDKKEAKTTKKKVGKKIMAVQKKVKKPIVVKKTVVKATRKKIAKKSIKKTTMPAKKIVKKVNAVAIAKKPVVKIMKEKIVKKRVIVASKKVEKKSNKSKKQVIKKVVLKTDVIKKIVEKKDKKTEEKPKEKSIKQEIKKDAEKYYKGIGKRKRAVASVRLYLNEDKIFIINNKPADIYFNNVEYQKIIYESLETMNIIDRFKIEVLVSGGGIHAQSEAIRHGISRALLEFDETFRKKLKTIGLLTRDPRRRERKKPGLKRARKATQWRKR